VSRWFNVLKHYPRGDDPLTRLIDLSHVIRDQIPVYPGDVPCSLEQVKSVDRDGYTSFLLHTALHAGTHLDAPLHFIAEGAMIQDLPLDAFVGQGSLLDVRGKAVVGYEPEYSSLVAAGDIVILWTGHSSKFGSDAYYRDHPIIDEGLASFFVEKGIRMLGLDTPSPDRYPFAVHKKILGAGIPIIENLVNLHELASLNQFEIMAFPLRIAAEGSPVRVVAREL